MSSSITGLTTYWLLWRKLFQRLIAILSFNTFLFVISGWYRRLMYSVSSTDLVVAGAGVWWIQGISLNAVPENGHTLDVTFIFAHAHHHQMFRAMIYNKDSEVVVKVCSNRISPFRLQSTTFSYIYDVGFYILLVVFDDIFALLFGRD